VTVVSDTGPLIALAKVGQLSVMAHLFTEVLTRCDVDELQGINVFSRRYITTMMH
jgi:predicted nucleic acid-binding protein